MSFKFEGYYSVDHCQLNGIFFSSNETEFRVIPLLKSNPSSESSASASTNYADTICQRKILGLPYVYANYDEVLVMPKSVIKMGIFVCHEYFFDDGVVFFREGMKSMYGIRSVVLNGLNHEVSPELFPPYLPYPLNGKLYPCQLTTELTPNHERETKSIPKHGSIGFLLDHYDHHLNNEFNKVKLRNYVAELFITNLKASGGRKCINFDFYCNDTDFFYLIGNDLISYYCKVGKSERSVEVMDSISFRKDFSQGYNVRVIVSSPSALYSSFGSRFHYVPTFENRKGPKEDLIYICLNYDNAELAITFDFHANKVHVRAPTYQRNYDEIFTTHSQRVEFITNAKINWEGKVVHDRVTNVSYVVVKIEDNAYDFVYENNKNKNVSVLVAWLLDLKEPNLIFDAKFVELCSDVWNTRINFCVPINAIELDHVNFSLKAIGERIVRRKIDQPVTLLPDDIEEVLPCKLRVNNADSMYEQPLMDWIEKYRVKGSWIQNELLSELKAKNPQLKSRLLNGLQQLSKKAVIVQMGLLNFDECSTFDTKGFFTHTVEGFFAKIMKP